MKKILYKIALPIRRLYWFIFRPKTYGVKCMIENDNKILFIKSSYGGDYWTFPGGGVGKGESPEDAVKREVKEELGVILTDIKKLGEYNSALEYKRDTVYCFYGKAETPTEVTKSAEVAEIKWCSLDNIPAPLSTATKKILKMH